MFKSPGLTKPPRKAVAFFVSTLFICVVVSGCSQSAPPADILRRARVALSAGKYIQVEKLAQEIPEAASEWQAGQLLAGEAASKDSRLQSALAYYRAAAKKDGSTADGQLALFSAAEVHLQLGELDSAERIYRGILKEHPRNGITNARMAFLLSVTGRRWEALDYYFRLIKGGDAEYRELALAADVGRDIEPNEFLDRCRQQAPNNKLVRLALATNAFSEGDEQAEALLTQLVEDHPELTSAQAMLGEMLVDLRDPARFINWYRSLPPDAYTSPDVSFVYGLWARKQSDLKTAVECFWRTVTLTPFHRRGFYVLGQCLVALGDPQAEQVVTYSNRLIQLSQSLDKVLISHGNDQHALRNTTELLEALGRTWEACAWAVVARDLFPDATWPSEVFQRLSHKLNDSLPRIEAALNPVADRQLIPADQFTALMDATVSRVATNARSVSSSGPRHSQIQFTETARISFQYFNSDDPKTRGVRTFEQTGGGVAILDFNNDNAPDVFLSQGAEWITGKSTPNPASEYHDGLYRNHTGTGFEDVSIQLTGPDTGYGQGCTAGDFDNDGFTDLYIANVGRNALYRNMGDGTFENVTHGSGIDDNSWTVSVMMCDLNADGLPDLFDVNYLEGEGVFEKICDGRACSPSVFPGARDRLLINLGNGEFQQLTDATPDVDSRGLGVVAFEIGVKRRPVIFIANDQVANYFLSNHPSNNPLDIELSNNAMVAGLAFNDMGLPMACMGIAVDDWDGNNLLDLLVTNFHDEPNTLYLQDAPGMFIDGTRFAGLQAASMPVTGWGTQSLDADLDGDPDLVVTNGHVDDYRDEGGEYQMRPQFFHNRNGQFRELTSEDAGVWFGDKYLGRGLARVDWNMDGLPEFIVSHINSPVAVLRNDTIGAGHYLNVKLIATETARDAIGATATIRRFGESVTRQLVAGDGYMASNERLIQFGLADVPVVDELIVNWPSGATTLIGSPPVNSTLIVTEGKNAVTLVRQQQVTSLLADQITEPQP